MKLNNLKGAEAMERPQESEDIIAKLQQRIKELEKSSVGVEEIEKKIMEAILSISELHAFHIAKHLLNQFVITRRGKE